MSHVTVIDLLVKDLDCLAAAAAELGLELVRGQKTFKWYGAHVGDYPLPAGFTKTDMGKCDHALRVKGASGGTYEIGVVRRRDGKAGYTLMWDFYHGGYGLQDKVGEGCKKLVQGYAKQVVLKGLMPIKAKGYHVSTKVLENGEVQIRCVR